MSFRNFVGTVVVSSAMVLPHAWPIIRNELAAHRRQQSAQHVLQGTDHRQTSANQQSAQQTQQSTNEHRQGWGNYPSTTDTPNRRQGRRGPITGPDICTCTGPCTCDLPFVYEPPVEQSPVDASQSWQKGR